MADLGVPGLAVYICTCASSVLPLRFALFLFFCFFCQTLSLGRIQAASVLSSVLSTVCAHHGRCSLNTVA